MRMADTFFAHMQPGSRISDGGAIDLSEVFPIFSMHIEVPIP